MEAQVLIYFPLGLGIFYRKVKTLKEFPPGNSIQLNRQTLTRPCPKHYTLLQEYMGNKDIAPAMGG